MSMKICTSFVVPPPILLAVISPNLQPPYEYIWNVKTIITTLPQALHQAPNY